jgi:hypothetical protein
VCNFRWGGGQCEDELEGKITKVVAELEMAARWGHDGGRLPCSMATGGGNPWRSSGQGKRPKRNTCSLPVLTNSKGELECHTLFRYSGNEASTCVPRMFHSHV